VDRFLSSAAYLERLSVEMIQPLILIQFSLRFHPLWILFHDLVLYLSQEVIGLRRVAEHLQGKIPMGFQKSLMSDLKKHQLSPDFVNV
jgi:hypothetical protein